MAIAKYYGFQRRGIFSVEGSTLWASQRIVGIGNDNRHRLSDPRNRNHKSVAIGSHNSEVASFSRSRITAKSQCRNQRHRIGPKKSQRFGIGSLVVRKHILGGFHTYVALVQHYKTT